ncbi:MAG TPA: cyclic lactone autoinducer peptide [Clostridia bacterium]
MIKSKSLSRTLQLISCLSLLIASVSSTSCEPWFLYQPKMPKSLIK